MFRQMMLVTAAALGLAACSFPVTKMEAIDKQLQPASQSSAASPPTDAAQSKPSKSQRASNQPSG
jgi:hypothetical protein